MSPPILFSDTGCPYAHRVLAVLDHLDVAHEHQEAPPRTHPPGLEHHSPSGRIPLLVHDDLVIGESAIILEYLAERRGFAEAWPRDLVERTRHRHAMALVDGVLTPRLFKDNETEPVSPRVRETLNVVDAVVRAADPGPSILAFHIAPVWLRFRAWHPKGTTTCAVRERTGLAAWLDAAADIPSIARTARFPAISW